jgi:small subunit ribosomal protein S3
MGQKINPIGLRLGINRTWDSRWFAGKNEYGKLLHEDVKIREILHKELKQAAVARIVIERPHKKCRVTIHSARPGVVIGKKGADIDKLRKRVADITASDVVINIVEIRKPELDATLVAESIAQQLERRVAFRRAMKRAVQSAMRLGAEGIRINCSGRLGGAEIARMEWYREGRVPLHTLRADIDKLRKRVADITASDVVINIVEIRKPELDATLVAESIAQQLERRVAFRRAMKRAVQSAMRLGAEGIRINCSGRLGGAEIARMEWYREGRVPLHTLRADIDYGVATAFTTFGTCGVKVWIFKGEILEHDPMAQDKKMAEGDNTRPRRDAA